MSTSDDSQEQRRPETRRSHPGVLLADPPSPIGKRGEAASSEKGAARYVRIEQLERTPKAVLWLCKDVDTQRTVVLKELDSDDALSRRLFLREARIQGQLEHPGIVPVYDLGAGANGQLYFTMQRLNGTSLRTVLEGLKSGNRAMVERFSRDHLLDVFRQLCLTVDYIHESSVIHRNIKPENVNLGDFGEIKLIDWSLARVTAPPVSKCRGHARRRRRYRARRDSDRPRLCCAGTTSRRPRRRSPSGRLRARRDAFRNPDARTSARGRHDR